MTPKKKATQAVPMLLAFGIFGANSHDRKTITAYHFANKMETSQLFSLICTTKNSPSRNSSNLAKRLGEASGSQPCQHPYIHI